MAETETGIAEEVNTGKGIGTEAGKETGIDLELKIGITTGERMEDVTETRAEKEMETGMVGTPDEQVQSMTTINDLSHLKTLEHHGGDLKICIRIDEIEICLLIMTEVIVVVGEENPVRTFWKGNYFTLEWYFID